MSDKYKIHEEDKAYFLTMTVVNWIDVFTRKNHKMAIVDSLKYCQENNDQKPGTRYNRAPISFYLSYI